MEKEYYTEEEYKSRTQLKNEDKALKKLGERLLKFSPEQLARVDMPEELREAVLFAKRITSREARRRQLQLIGRLMRHIDPTTIREAIEGKDHQSREAVEAFHQIEQWRKDLIEGSDALVEELCERLEGADRQKLRQLARNARKEREREKPPKSARQLFRYLRTLSEDM